ncbi:MAG: hypothetical protein GX066_06305 [Clostridiaceae bacterium]|nr:hypothetical protein [Clostridiaceae bacterium]
MTLSVSFFSFTLFLFCGKIFDLKKDSGSSILVSSTDSEDGPKNPLKGTSMKFLVLAFDAQSGVSAGS